jgi:hypothetical protein
VSHEQAEPFALFTPDRCRHDGRRAGCGRADGHTRRTHRGASAATATITRTWPAAAIRELRVFEVDGSISVEAAQTSEISLVATARGELDLQKGVENDGLFETKLEGDTLRIGRREENQRKRFRFDIPFLFGHEDKRIDYVLRVPPTVSLEMMTVNGRIGRAASRVRRRPRR